MYLTIYDLTINMPKRNAYANERAFSTIKAWFNRRFTRSGLLVLWAILFTAGLGVDMYMTMAYQAFSFLVCLLAASVLWGLLSRKKFSAERILPKFGTVGSPLPYRIAIQNKGGSVQRGLILAENLPDPQPQGENRLEPAEKKRNWFDHGGVNDRALWSVTKNRSAEAGQLSLPALAPYAETEVYHQLVPSKRGTLRLSGMTIFWPDPFGLFRSLSKIKCSQSVLILPKRYFLPPFELPGTMKYQHGGVALASSVGESEEFVALRDYRPGDLRIAVLHCGRAERRRRRLCVRNDPFRWAVGPPGAHRRPPVAPGPGDRRAAAGRNHRPRGRNPRRRCLDCEANRAQAFQGLDRCDSR